MIESGIEFIEDQNEGYAPRTRINASADITLAFALDFTTAGEKLTKRCVMEQGKMYIPISKIYYEGWAAIGDVAFESAIRCKNGITTPKDVVLNIAGNGIYTLKSRLQQYQVDRYVFKFVTQFVSFLQVSELNVVTIRSGGQTGFDEAGLKAAQKLNIPAICLAPKGWKFRNIAHRDISDEQEFKERFIITK